jgi:hypothetical protein
VRAYVGTVAPDTGRFRERKDILMGFDDALNKAKDYAGENPDKVEQGLDGASEQIKDRAPDSVDGHVDTGADAARGHLGLGDDEQGEGNQGG